MRYLHRTMIAIFLFCVLVSCTQRGEGVARIVNSSTSATRVQLSDYEDNSRIVDIPSGSETYYSYVDHCFVMLPNTENRKLIYQNNDVFTIRDKPTTTEIVYFTNITGSTQVVFNKADDLTGEISIPAFVKSPNSGDPDYKNHPVSITWMLGLDLQAKSDAVEKPVIETKIENGKKYILIREPGFTIP